MSTAQADANRRCSADEVAQRLRQELPGWDQHDGQLRRRYRTSGWKSTLLAVNTIGHLAEAAWHHPELQVGYDSVTVLLSTHSAGGITDKDFTLARQIDTVLLWTPGPPAPKQPPHMLPD